MSEEKVICPKCGGEIDEETLVCNSCGAKYTRGEYEELKNEQSLKSWLLGGDSVDDELFTDEENADALKKWLEGDESAFLDWTEEDALGEEKVSEMKAEAAEMVASAEAGEVNIDEIIKENIRLKSLIEVESSKREELENEVETLKKQLEVLQQEALKELPKEERDMKLLQMELKKKEIELEMREKRLQLETQKMGGLAPEELEELKKMVGEGDTSALLEKINELTRQIAEKEKTIAELKNDLAIKEEEMRKLQEMISFKENEIARREQDLMFREKKLEKEIKNLQLARNEIGNMDEIALKRHLEDLQDEIKRKEEELRVKMKYLEAKERELKAKMEGLVEAEVEAAEEEIKAEIKERKVKTGTRRLDDLLYGGFPLASNVIVYGPPYSKKEVLVYSFVAEGLRKGIPVIWVLTDKTPLELREEMSYVLPTYEQYEKMKLVYYVDAYSRSIGDDTTLDGVIYLDSQTDVDGIIKTVGEISKKIKEKHPYYRLAFITLSTMMAYLEQQDLLRFLQVFTTWRKRDNAVAVYIIEKGLHSENEIEMVGKSMSGMIEFKMEGHKTYLTVKGVTDVQSRGWIEVEATKSMVRLGSFSLGHIR